MRRPYAAVLLVTAGFLVARRDAWACPALLSGPGRSRAVTRNI